MIPTNKAGANDLKKIWVAKNLTLSNETNTSLAGLATNPNITESVKAAAAAALTGQPLDSNQMTALKIQLESESIKPIPDKNIMASISTVMQANRQHEFDQLMFSRNEAIIGSIAESMQGILSNIQASADQPNENSSPSNFVFPSSGNSLGLSGFVPQVTPALFVPNNGVTFVPGSAVPSGNGVVISSASNVTNVPDDQTGTVNQLVQLGLTSDESESLLKTKKKTRFIRLANATDDVVTVNLKYASFDEMDSEVVTEKPLSINLEPGQEVDLFEGNWRVNASKMRIWAENEDGSKRWDRFKDKTFNLVPNGSYEATDLETLVFKIQ